MAIKLNTHHAVIRHRRVCRGAASTGPRRRRRTWCAGLLLRPRSRTGSGAGGSAQSGALTFHAPVETPRPTCGGPSEVSFIVPVPRPERSPASKCAVTQAIKAIVVKVAGHAADAAVGLVLGKLARALKHRPGSARSSREGWLKVDKATLSAGRLAVRRGEHRATPPTRADNGSSIDLPPLIAAIVPAARTSPLSSRP
jgi:hypothetical protein